uniref:Galectin n=1 Tax=Astyanax mexicanus TaxID=7994 RepID=A0A8B9H5P4_ASTMX
MKCCVRWKRFLIINLSLKRFSGTIICFLLKYHVSFLYRFYVNLYKNNDIAFYFNPQFKEDGKEVIVRNSMVRNNWGTEERELPFFPFTPGEYFEEHLLNFTHRIKEIHQIRKLTVKGDVFVQHVTIDPSTYRFKKNNISPFKDFVILMFFRLSNDIIKI